MVVVSNHYEDTIWKQITTVKGKLSAAGLLWAIITKIQSESKSQLVKPGDTMVFRCEQSLRRYNLKANHNTKKCFKPTSMLWAIITKIQSESKSQHVSFLGASMPRCEQSLRRYNLKANHNSDYYNHRSALVVSNHYEDTIWKQITTHPLSAFAVFVLWAIITKIQSESKSQRVIRLTADNNSCEQSLRRYNLKANHN